MSSQVTPPRAAASAYACPRCHEVHPGLYRVEYQVGLTLIGPTLVCITCLHALREQEATDSGMDSAFAITLIGRVGSPEPEQALEVAA